MTHINGITWQEMKPSLTQVEEGNKLQQIRSAELARPFSNTNTACSGSSASSLISWNHFFTRPFKSQVSAIYIFYFKVTKTPQKAFFFYC